jgi:hypothetical protein
METLDRIFLIIFGRFRRKLGNSNIASAWNRANYKVAGYMLWLISSVTMIVVVLSYCLTGGGAPARQKQSAQVIGVVTWFAFSFLLNRRYLKYLSNPPQLAAKESIQDRQLLTQFRIFCVGTFIVTGALGTFLHSEFRLFEGF